MNTVRPRATLVRLLAPALALACLALAGCAGPSRGPAVARPVPNVRGPEVWSEEWARVAVLPAHDATGRLTPDFVSSLGESWLRALITSRRAEFVRVDEAALVRRHGPGAGGSASPLPHGLLAGAAADTGADALMLLELTQVSPYPPLSLGFRARLVRPSDGETLWMADEIFDARDPAVVAYARAEAKRRAEGPGDAQAAVTLSPTRFADHAFRTVAETLPPRRAPAPPADEKAAKGAKEAKAAKNANAEKIADDARLSPQKFPVRADSTR